MMQPHPLPSLTQSCTECRDTVLVVDDSRVQRKILSATLRNYGYHVLEVASGEEALELFARARINMVVCDWMMPGMSGPELCTKLRDLSEDEYLYIILLTTKSEKSDIASGLEAGADDFLPKPFHGPELVARIKAGQRLQAAGRQLHEKNQLLSSTLSELRNAYAVLDNDLKSARQLQRSLLRDPEVRFGGLHVAAMLEPSGHIGGDLVGFFPINERQFGVYALDVSGHGVSSALMTARLAGYFSGSTPWWNIVIDTDEKNAPIARPLTEVAGDLNTRLMHDLQTDHYLTLMLAVVDPWTGHASVIQAGHPPAIILRSSGKVEVAGDGGLPIGLIEEASYVEFAVQLGVGDRMVFVSDGLTECTAVNGHMLEEDGLIGILQNQSEKTGPAMLAGVLSDLSDFAGKESFDDDVSAVAIDFQR